MLSRFKQLLESAQGISELGTCLKHFRKGSILKIDSYIFFISIGIRNQFLSTYMYRNKLIELYHNTNVILRTILT
jgi:hypothetical protein